MPTKKKPGWGSAKKSSGGLTGIIVRIRERQPVLQRGRQVEYARPPPSL